MKSEIQEKEERKSKNENTHLRRWRRKNLTALPYLRIYFRGLNAIEKRTFIAIIGVRYAKNYLLKVSQTVT